MRERRRIYTIVAAFSLLLVGGIIYAAVTGNLAFDGTAGFNPNVRLNMVQEQIVNIKAGESVTVDPSGQTLTFTVRLDEPGENRNVRFRIENVGNTGATLGTLTTTPPTGNGVNINWPTLNNVAVEPGTTTGEHMITVTWDPAYPQATQDVTLSATINYAQTT
jgi:hypothetical protein